jgi:type I restriction enzyme R subunit
MFLTGFDATTLNTLGRTKTCACTVDAGFFATNRILNSVKTFGNIVCFRNLEEATTRAFRYSATKMLPVWCLLKTYEEYYYG